MKQITIVLIAALVSGLCGFYLVQRRHAVEAAALSGTRGDDLAWIRAEFGLNDVHYAAVKALHADYSIVCAQHCADIAAAQTRLQELTTRGAAPAEIEAARRDVAALEDVCNTATRAHIRRVAEAMPAGQGQRYIAIVEPHLAHSPHDPATPRDGLGRH